MEESESTKTNGSNSNDELQLQIQFLEEEKRKMQNEFNTQRAKLKELFIQKESELGKCLTDKQLLQRELDELKCQVLVADLKSDDEMKLNHMKAQEEILSLQQLVQDTLEESTVCKSELVAVKEANNRFCQENRELREELQQAATSSLGPQVLNQVKKTFARKIIGETSIQQGSIDLKNSAKNLINEDAEVLRSIVEQLQEEMQALKEKLREADEKLQAKENNNLISLRSETVTHKTLSPTSEAGINKSTSTEILAVVCDNCKILEEKLQELVNKSNKDEETLESMRKNLTEARDELQKEAALRKDLEDQWQEKREAHKTEVQLLREQVKTNEQQLLDLQQKFLETKDHVTRQLQRISDDRENVNKHLETLQADNDFLSGCYLATAEEIESQYINLPNTVDELQELILRQQNDLIQARVGSAYEKKKWFTSRDEIQILREKLDESNSVRRAYERKVETKMKSLQDRLTEHLLTLQHHETKKAALERKEAELNRQISEIRVENIELNEANEKLNKINSENKAKIKNMQTDLATSEQVQNDFVKLSQKLQMSLEQLRQADTNVRWQDDDDIDNCPACSTYFTVTVRKTHCRHCGQIYCDKCLSKTVPSGPRKRLARVCDMCHTLLTPNTAPYFSHEPANAT